MRQMAVNPGAVQSLGTCPWKADCLVEVAGLKGGLAGGSPGAQCFEERYKRETENLTFAAEVLSDGSEWIMFLSSL
ncbi:hypothetical protein E5288_WYG022668 [Bos mutus]|uniref:Uncharacterized protein n=1 Tax=Bos mutus TaxID=72004 RepID=A0A6B0R059_9CETA|nr:hypothetical protein [Bos mutus]